MKQKKKKKKRREGNTHVCRSCNSKEKALWEKKNGREKEKRRKKRAADKENSEPRERKRERERESLHYEARRGEISPDQTNGPRKPTSRGNVAV